MHACYILPGSTYYSRRQQTRRDDDLPQVAVLHSAQVLVGHLVPLMRREGGAPAAGCSARSAHYIYRPCRPSKELDSWPSPPHGVHAQLAARHTHACTSPHKRSLHATCMASCARATGRPAPSSPRPYAWRPADAPCATPSLAPRALGTGAASIRDQLARSRPDCAPETAKLAMRVRSVG